MAYTPPRLRSCAALAGQQHYPAAGSPLDVRPFVRTAVPAGARGRIVSVGDNLYEANDLTRPVRFCGNNQGASLKTGPMDKALLMDAAEKFAARGINFIRFHITENYLMVDGAVYTEPVARIGNCNFSPSRWDEFCYFVYCLKQKGVYISYNPGSPNLAINLGNNANRYDNTGNSSGSITLTVTNGVITAAVPNVASTGHNFPPTIVVSVPDGQPGVGAKLKANINASGTVTSYDIISGGANYVQGQVTASIFGGGGRGKARLRLDDNVRAQWVAMVSSILTTVNPYTGMALVNDPVLAFMECMNESHMGAPVSGGTIASVYRAQLTPKWQKWLYDRYNGDIAQLNTRYGGTTFTQFSDSGLAYRLIGTTPTNRAERCLWSDSITWMNNDDVEFFSWCIGQLRSMGYNGLVTTRDMGSDLAPPKTNYETGTSLQTFHAYPALQDAYLAGESMTCGGTKNNSPASYADNPMWACLTSVLKGMPRFWTEAGYPMPGKYRGEMGPLFASVSSMYDFAGITYHASPAVSLRFGPQNPSMQKGLWPHNWENDPLTLSSVWLGSMIFHRRDVDALAITKELVINNRALSIHMSPSETTDPAYSSRQQFLANDMSLMLPITRIESSWDSTNSASIATTWLGTTGINETYVNLLPRCGFGASHEAYQWVIAQGNTDQNSNGDRPNSAARYTQNRQVFFDRTAGVFGINTPRSQVAVPSKPFRNQLGTRVKQGIAFVSNAARTQKGLPGNGYTVNFMGNRFWQNVLINHIEDGVLLGVTSASMDPIASAQKILIVAAGNFYNKGASWQSMANGVASVAVTTRGTYTVAPWVRFDGNGNGAIGRCILGADGGIDSVEIVERGVNYSTTPTASLQGGTGSGGVLGAVTMTADDENKEVKLLTPYTADGMEGWPIGQARHVADFTITGVDPLANWRMYELDYSGKRIGTVRTRRTKTGINIRIDSSRTVQPSVFFELVKE